MDRNLIVRGIFLKSMMLGNQLMHWIPMMRSTDVSLDP